MIRFFAGVFFGIVLEANSAEIGEYAIAGLFGVLAILAIGTAQRRLKEDAQ